MNRIEEVTAEPEVDVIYDGKVIRIVDFGAFVEIIPGTEGLLHISQIAEERVEKVSDYISEGDMIRVKVIDMDQRGRIKLSMKEAKRDEGGADGSKADTPAEAAPETAPESPEAEVAGSEAEQQQQPEATTQPEAAEVTAEAEPEVVTENKEDDNRGNV